MVRQTSDGSVSTCPSLVFIEQRVVKEPPSTQKRGT